jgi:prepilin-type N-terminal cleavage/methylation domain-containing protein/prepilin-type processing-associated H-X9-DG protein
MPRHRSRIAAFTLVELLIVIAIIGVLVSLLLPAVQSAREAARRVTCLNNLKQWSLAVNNYESAKRQLPPAGDVAYGYPDYEFYGDSGKMFSWVVFTLPYIEEQNLADRIDKNRDIVNQPGDPQAAVLSAMLCPSDDSRDLYYVPPYSFFRGKKFAKGNYAAYVSPFHVELHPWFPGALVAGKTWKVKNIVDGPSHTLMLSEIRVRRHPEDQRGAWALPWTGSSLLAFDMHPPDDFTLDSANFAGSDVSLGLTQRPNNIGPNVDMLYDCPADDLARAQLEGMPCGVFDFNYGNPSHYLSAAPRSQHTGGVNVAFMDGRLGFLVNEVDEYTMAYLVSANDRKPIQFDDYVR